MTGMRPPCGSQAMSPAKLPGQAAPDCATCAHYFITHEAATPHGCRLLKLKSRRMPHLDVLEASGMPCLAYRSQSPSQKPSRKRGES
jgi:hypothetical protein